jgi:hypothetical protein
MRQWTLDQATAGGGCCPPCLLSCLPLSSSLSVPSSFALVSVHLEPPVLTSGLLVYTMTRHVVLHVVVLLLSA